MKDLRQSPGYARFMASKGWGVESLPATPLPQQSSRGKRESTIFAYLRRIPFVPLSVMKVQRFDRLPDLEALRRLVWRRRVVSVTLEPGTIVGLSMTELDWLLTGRGFRPSRWPFLPSKTIRIDLTPGEDDLLGAMRKDARASIRKARGAFSVQIASHEDRLQIERFQEFWLRHGKGSILGLSELRALFMSFRGDAFLVLAASHSGTLLAGAVILHFERCAYYTYAATSALGRKALTGYLVVWEAMREARRRGCTSFDLEGVYDQRFPLLKRWRGFSAFKEKFGGEVFSYPPPYTRSFLLPALLSLLPVQES